MDNQMKRGLLDACVLASIKNAPSYGYQIIKDMKPFVEISESTLYPILRRLEAAKLLTKARGQVCHALGCKPEELVFTSCGSEGDNWALRCGAEYRSRCGRHILSSAAEHAAVPKCCAFAFHSMLLQG